MLDEKSMKEIKHICRKCALESGVTWPIGHIATCNILKCDACLETGAMASISDWNIDIEIVKKINKKVMDKKVLNSDG